MRLIERQGSMFKRYITEKCAEMFKSIRKWCLHINRTLSRQAFDALDAFLLIIADELVSSNRSADSNRATLRDFLKEFWSGLESLQCSILEVSVCVRGFGYFAKATQEYMSSAEVKKILQKLLVFSDQYYSKYAKAMN